MRKYILMILVLCGFGVGGMNTASAASSYCVTPEYNRAYFDQKTAIFRAVVQDIRPARRSDFGRVHPVSIDDTLYATLNVTAVYQDNYYRALRRGRNAWLAYDAGAGAEFREGEEILILADRGYGNNRFWVGACNPTLRQSLLPDISSHSVGARILRSILR